MSKARAISVLRHDPPDVSDVHDDGVVFSVVTVICGHVTGEVDVYIYREPGGRFVQSFGTRIDGVTQGRAGVAELEMDRIGELADLAAVADILSDELARLKGAGTRTDMPAVEPELFRVSDGSSHLIVWRGDDDVTIRIETGHEDFREVTLPPRTIGALRDALDGL